MKGKINELPNIDTSRYSIDENGNVLRDKRITEVELATANAIQDINKKFDFKLRDLFAMGAIVGMSANSDLNNHTLEDLAELAYKQADAMLKARKK